MFSACQAISMEFGSYAKGSREEMRYQIGPAVGVRRYECTQQINSSMDSVETVLT